MSTEQTGEGGRDRELETLVSADGRGRDREEREREKESGGRSWIPHRYPCTGMCSFSLHYQQSLLFKYTCCNSETILSGRHTLMCVLMAFEAITVMKMTTLYNECTVGSWL